MSVIVMQCLCPERSDRLMLFCSTLMRPTLSGRTKLAATNARGNTKQVKELLQQEWTDQAFPVVQSVMSLSVNSKHAPPWSYTRSVPP